MQGFNMGRYVPPDLEGRVSSNAASGKGHALGARARKLKSEGILTVRFECPFAIWCTTCQPEQIIAQGVRFNAEKKKVGNYYSTPVWGFRIKHTVCGGWLEIRTDPKNAEYVVVEGGRRRDYGGEKLLDGEMRIGAAGVTEEEKDRLERDGGFAGLEKKVEDKRAGLAQKQRLDELTRLSGRDWSDPYERSQALRREFRVGRRKRQDDERTGEALKERFGIDVDILPRTDEDDQRAKLVDFGKVKSTPVSAKPLFPEKGSSKQQPEFRGNEGTGQKLASQTPKHKTVLQHILTSNSRPTADPFMREEKAWKPGAKRKRSEKDGIPTVEQPGLATSNALGTAVPLVDYDSDFE